MKFQWSHRTGQAASTGFAGYAAGFPAQPSRHRPSVLNRVIDYLAPCPWPASSGASTPFHPASAQLPAPLYTQEQRCRRDSSRWTLVQGVLAPLQFLIFAVSLCLVVRFLLTGAGYEAATISILIKTAALYTIMLTGAIWEKKVFGQYLFAPAFFWEDVFSMLVIALHTLYVITLLQGQTSPAAQMTIALAAYFSYVINATQFVLKLRAARRDDGGSARLPRDTRAA